MAEIEINLDLCATCPRRELDLRYRPEADRAVGHIVMDGVFATDAIRRYRLRGFIQNQVAAETISQREANMARDCAMSQQDGSCGHYQEEPGEDR